jgi:hypothetical protein
MNVCSLASVNSAPPYGEDDADDEPDEDEISWAVVVAADDVELALFSEPSDATVSRAAFDVSLLPVLSVRLLYGRRSLFAALKHNKNFIAVIKYVFKYINRKTMKRTCFGHSDIEALL